MTEPMQHTLVACMALIVLGILGWRGMEVGYAVAAVVAAAVGGRAVSAFANPPPVVVTRPGAPNPFFFPAHDDGAPK